MSNKNGSNIGKSSKNHGATLPVSLLGWLALFGPGAVIASLTIGTGELIFSSRGGAIFGYRILFLFLIISILKWGLVMGTARHMVLSGVHPLRRWMELPGPRGWLPVVLFMLAAGAIPVWVSFHAGVIGNLLGHLTNTHQANGIADLLWGIGVLCGVLLLASCGGYSLLERIQLLVVVGMLVSVVVSLFFYNPNWASLISGALIPSRLEYPAWLGETNPQIAKRPIWIELTLYVGVIGGGGLDYLAYTSFLRAKKWGAAAAPLSRDQLEAVADDSTHAVRRWLWAPLLDCSLSFYIVFVFSLVFVTCGTLLLAPAHKVPDGTNFLQLQAQFVAKLYPALTPLYFMGALLTMLGTLYGTLEVAPTIMHETVLSFRENITENQKRWLRRATLIWCGAGALLILSINALRVWSGAKMIDLVALLTPANLFTGVMCCGVICLLSPWADYRFLPRSLRMSRVLSGMNLLAGVAFIALGIKGYLDWGHINGLQPWTAMLMLGGTIAVGWLGAWILNLLGLCSPHSSEPPLP